MTDYTGPTNTYTGSTWPTPTQPTTVTITDPATGKTVSQNVDTARYTAQITATQAEVNNTLNYIAKAEYVAKTGSTLSATTDYSAIDLSTLNINPLNRTISKDVLEAGATSRVVFNPPAHNITRARNPKYKPGFIIQEINDSNIATVNKDAQIEGLRSKNQLWGFQFMYNPTGISMTAANDSTIDAMLNSAATPLRGTTSFSFDILLNRIVDVSTLRKDGSQSATSSYSRSLTQADLWGLANRGTAYDLDFLYRVCNGDPRKDNPQLDDATQYMGDVGYLVASPVWVTFGKNFRFRGGISNITINHTMFSVDMVPILSSATITVSRYPSVTMLGSESQEVLKNSAWEPTSTEAEK